MNRLIFLLIAINLFGCRAGFKVNSEILRPSDYSENRSFKFVDPKNISKANFSFSEENQKIIFDAIATELKKRGFTSHKKAKYVIKVQGGTEFDDITRSGNRRNYDPYRYNWYFPYDRPYLRDDISRKKSTIILEIMDSESGKLLWHGVASGEMGRKEEEVPNRIKEAVRDIIDNSPLPPPTNSID